MAFEKKTQRLGVFDIRGQTFLVVRGINFTLPSIAVKPT